VNYFKNTFFVLLMTCFFQNNVYGVTYDDADAAYSMAISANSVNNSHERFLMSEAKKGDINSEVFIGKYFYNVADTSNNPKKYCEKSMVWLKKAMKDGAPSAAYFIAERYNNSNGLKNRCGENPDYKKAFKYFRRSARSGYPGAQFFLAIDYHNGIGTDIDKSKAIFWIKKAAVKCDAARNTEGSLGWDIGPTR
jgi:TPR repeat protein